MNDAEQIAATTRLRQLCREAGIVISCADLIREVDAGRLFGVSTRTMRAWRHAGTGPRSVRVGGQHRYELGAIAEYLWQEVAETGKVSVADAAEPVEDGADTYPTPRTARK